MSDRVVIYFYVILWTKNSIDSYSKLLIRYTNIKNIYKIIYIDIDITSIVSGSTALGTLFGYSILALATVREGPLLFAPDAAEEEDSTLRCDGSSASAYSLSWK